MDEHVTRESIDRAIAWYWANRSAIVERLPIVTPGVIFKSGWTVSVERQIEVWGKDEYLLSLAAVYIHRPLRLIAGAMKPSVPTKEA